MKRIYLDYAAGTPVDPRIFSAMKPYFAERFGNPGSLHAFGQQAIAAIDASRETIARAIGARFREIIFTSSATEANNLALRGVVYAARARMKHEANFIPRIIVSAIEHESILETARDLEREGVDVVYVPVHGGGVVDLAVLKQALNERTVLVSIMFANNEIGTIQPIAEISKIIKNFREEQGEQPFPVMLHTDATQAFQFCECNPADLGVDIMTFSSHKIYGPKGAGALYIKEQATQEGKIKNKKMISIQPLLSGGGQEFGLRSGTENVPAIVGFAKAIELAVALRAKEVKRVNALKDALWKGIKKISPAVEINGVASQTRDEKSLPNMLNVYFPGASAQDLLTKLDLKGLAVSSGSACRSRAMESSYVIEALGHSKERAKSSIRFSLGRPTTAGEIKAALKLVKDAI
jgi:cysteine desulfurase